MKTATLPLLSVVLSFGCGEGVAPTPPASDTSLRSEQPLGSADQAGGGIGPAIDSCPAICATLAAYGSDPSSACAGYCASPAGQLDVPLCDWCPGGNTSVNSLVGCSDQFTACQGYHCVSSGAPAVPVPWVGTGEDEDAGTIDAGIVDASIVDAGTTNTFDAGLESSVWACAPNQPNNTPAFVCVMINSPECVTNPNAEFCASLPLSAGAPGPDFVFLYVVCDPTEDADTRCPRDTGVR